MKLLDYSDIDFDTSDRTTLHKKVKEKLIEAGIEEKRANAEAKKEIEFVKKMLSQVDNLSKIKK